MTFLELIEAVSCKLTEQGIDHALIGGVAASFYRERKRLTDDVDFAIATVQDAEMRVGRIIESFDLKASILSKAQLDGGPRFALKSASRSQNAAVLGRNPRDKDAYGIDMLLPTNPWVPDAVRRAQANRRLIGKTSVPLITVEDLIVAKLYALAARPDRPYDLDDLQSILMTRPPLDVTYLAAKMVAHKFVIPKALHGIFPFQLLRISRKNARGRKI